MLPVVGSAAVVSIGNNHDAIASAVIEHPIREHSYACASQNRYFIPVGEHRRGLWPVKHMLFRSPDLGMEIIAEGRAFGFVPLGRFKKFGSSLGVNPQRQSHLRIAVSLALICA